MIELNVNFMLIFQESASISDEYDCVWASYLKRLQARSIDLFCESNFDWEIYMSG